MIEVKYIFWKHILIMLLFQSKTSKVSPSLTTLNPNCLALVEDLPRSGPIYFPVLAPIFPCVFCFSYTTLLIISSMHPILTLYFPTSTFLLMTFLLPEFPSYSCLSKFQPLKYLPFKTQLKCNLHKDSPPTLTFPIEWSLPLLFLFLATPWGLWDLNSPTRDRSRALCSGSEES